jgi:hypothetical protein
MIPLGELIPAVANVANGVRSPVVVALNNFALEDVVP